MAASVRPFPFAFVRQAAAGPGAIRTRGLPGDVHDGQVVALPALVEGRRLRHLAPRGRGEALVGADRHLRAAHPEAVRDGDVLVGKLAGSQFASPGVQPMRVTGRRAPRRNRARRRGSPTSGRARSSSGRGGGRARGRGAAARGTRTAASRPATTRAASDEEARARPGGVPRNVFLRTTQSCWAARCRRGRADRARASCAPRPSRRPAAHGGSARRRARPPAPAAARGPRASTRIVVRTCRDRDRWPARSPRAAPAGTPRRCRAAVLELARADGRRHRGRGQPGRHREGPRAGQRLVQALPERVDVDRPAGPAFSPRKISGRQVRERAHVAGRGERLPRLRHGDAEVHELHPAAAAEDDVRGLDVAVEDAGRVRVLERGGEGREGGERLRQGQRAALQPRLQGLAVRELHGQVGQPERRDPGRRPSRARWRGG